jgi:hypothetical protein
MGSHQVWVRCFKKSVLSIPDVCSPDSYPGYLCFEGEEKDVQEMVRRIKALQWHAVMVKTEEPYEYSASSVCSTMGEVREEAVLHCLLAHGHKKQDAGAKVRTTMIEVDSGKELVERRVLTQPACRLFR